MAEKLVTLGCFRVLTDLKSGVGSQGSVYKAVCEKEGFAGVAVGTVVALKVMPVQDDDKSLFARLRSRTEDLMGLSHPGIVRYLGCFSEPGPFNDVHVLVLEWLEGESLKDRLLRNPQGIDADETLRIGEKTLAALAYISSKGMVHRDIKPGNIFLCEDGGVKLIDFEVARPVGSGMTNAGTNMIGTFDYMAPDFTNPEFRGDEQSDIFSLGVCIHEMFTGRTPYRRQSSEDTQASFAFLSRWSQGGDGENPIKISTRVNKILAGATEVLANALRTDRKERFSKFSDFAAAFKGIRYRELAHGDNTWRLLLYVGRGGFGEVFKARDRKSGRVVAIKHLLKSAYAERFRREAKVMSKLTDPSFARFITFFEKKINGVESAFLVMEYLDGMPGQSLRDELRRAGGEQLPRDVVIRAFARYAHGLAALHAKGLVHRDIKPSNLYFPKGAIERAAIMDFGVARDTGGTETVGNVPGTLDYMPPEIAVEGSRGDVGMDLYALGLCLYEALSGKMAYPRLPEGSAGYQAFFERARKKTLPHLDASAYSDLPELVLLVVEMIEPEARRRLKDASVVERRLLNLLETSRTERTSADFAHEEEELDETGDTATRATIAPDDAALQMLAGEAKARQRRLTIRNIALVVVGLLVVGAAGLVLKGKLTSRGGDNVSVVELQVVGTANTNVSLTGSVENETVEIAEEDPSSNIETQVVASVTNQGDGMNPELLKTLRDEALAAVMEVVGKRPWGATVSTAVDQVRRSIFAADTEQAIASAQRAGFNLIALAKKADAEIAAKNAEIEAKRIQNLKRDALVLVEQAAGERPWASTVSNAVELARLAIGSALSAEDVSLKGRTGVDAVAQAKAAADAIAEQRIRAWRHAAIAEVERAAGDYPWAETVSNAVHLARLAIEAATSAEDVEAKGKTGAETVTMAKRTADEVEKQRLQSCKMEAVAAVEGRAGRQPWSAAVANAVKLSRIAIEAAATIDGVGEKRRIGEEAVGKAKSEEIVQSKPKPVPKPTPKPVDDALIQANKAKLEKTKAALDAYEIEYRKKKEEAMRPGSRIDPNELDREWYMRLREYKRLKKKLETDVKGVSYGKQ